MGARPNRYSARRKLEVLVAVAVVGAAIGTTAALAITRVKTTVTAHAASRTRVTGKVKSRADACKAKRKLRVVRVGTTGYTPTGTSGPRGAFRITAATSPYEKYYVDAARKRVKVGQRTIICRYGRSATFSPD